MHLAGDVTIQRTLKQLYFTTMALLPNVLTTPHRIARVARHTVFEIQMSLLNNLFCRQFPLELQSLCCRQGFRRPYWRLPDEGFWYAHHVPHICCGLHRHGAPVLPVQQVLHPQEIAGSKSIVFFLPSLGKLSQSPDEK